MILSLLSCPLECYSSVLQHFPPGTAMKFLPNILFGLPNPGRRTTGRWQDHLVSRSKCTEWNGWQVQDQLQWHHQYLILSGWVNGSLPVNLFIEQWILWSVVGFLKDDFLWYRVGQVHHRCFYSCLTWWIQSKQSFHHSTNWNFDWLWKVRKLHCR